MGTFTNTFGLNVQRALLKPLQDETKAYITGLTTPLSKAAIEVIDTYVKELKQATGGTLSQAFDFLFLSNAPTKETALKNLARDSFHIIDSNLPDYTPYYGYQGVSGKYLDPNYNLSTNKIVLSQNSSSMGFFSTLEAAANGNSDMGSTRNAAPYFLFQMRYTGDIARLHLSNALSSGKPNNTSKGFFIASRTDASKYEIYRDGVNIGTETIASGLLSNNKLLVLAAPLNTGVVSSFSNKECAVSFVGRGFTPTEITGINTASQKYVANLILARDYDYLFTTRYIATQKDNKVLEFDDDGTLYYSVDGGLNYTSKVTSPTIPIITFAHIFDNGNVIFADHTKVYLSTDNLNTYAETRVIGIDGNTFIPGVSTNNFRTIGCSDSVNIDGVEVLAWGCYIDMGAANVWYTKDCGVTIKSLWKSGVTLSPSTSITIDHIHTVVYNEEHNTWWMFTGDAESSSCWIMGTININTDVATWNIIGTGTVNYKSLSIFFRDGYAYWASDTFTTANYGIWRCLYADMGTPANWEHLFLTTNMPSGFIRNGNGCIATWNMSRNILVSDDMVNFRYIRVVGGPDINQAWNAYYDLMPKNSKGYFAADIWSNTESRAEYTKGPSLLLKF